MRGLFYWFLKGDWSIDMELRIERQTRGVRIITGDQARERRKLLNQLIDIADEFGFSEITLPSIEPSHQCECRIINT